MVTAVASCRITVTNYVNVKLLKFERISDTAKGVEGLIF
jgi:hypothetical protein